MRLWGLFCVWFVWCWGADADVYDPAVGGPPRKEVHFTACWGSFGISSTTSPSHMSFSFHAFA